MAALRNGVKTVIIPRDNEKDLDEIDQTVRTALQFVLVDQVDQVLAAALVPEVQEPDSVQINDCMALEGKKADGSLSLRQ